MPVMAQVTGTGAPARQPPPMVNTPIPEGDVAAVIAEPMRAVPYVAPPGFWRRVRDACEVVAAEEPVACYRAACRRDDGHRDELEELDRVGVDAVLIGGSLMTAADPEAKVRELTGMDEHTREHHLP